MISECFAPEFKHVADQLLSTVTVHEDLYEFNYVDLVSICTQRGLSVTGMMVEIIEEIDENFRKIDDKIKIGMMSFGFHYGNDIDRNLIKLMVEK